MSFDPRSRGGRPLGGQPFGKSTSGSQPSQNLDRGTRRGVGSRRWTLRPTKSPTNDFTFGNFVAVSTADFQLHADQQKSYLLLDGQWVFSAKMFDGLQPGFIGMSDPQRSWAGISMQDSVDVELYDPFTLDQTFLAGLDVEVGFAGKRTSDEPYDQDLLADAFVQTYKNQILAPGQRILMDVKSVYLSFMIKATQLNDFSEKPAASAIRSSTKEHARGMLTNVTSINFFKDSKSPIKLKGSSKRPAPNAIIQPNFKFEDMGIGGLDVEFSAIFRRAFASRIFPPGLVEKLGIQHVKGILLYGPPGTGKTLIARQIGKMLNAREPKIINGPEVLNKYVGQSEENIRKLFADAEKEYKEKGDESDLHIIIFDELDAVCKQRGSGAGGGTGVGDSVVNQLLSKLDGVDQLNNILLIGMTNRIDMIDDALLRPGRLEVHMEISLPDEHGRLQIISIHTAKMRANKVMDTDVDLDELAALTKNFSGAEISGLVKSASSFAFNRHVKVGTMAGISDDIENMKVNRQDFFSALEEVQPAFGVSEEELGQCIRGGIIRFSPMIDSILDEGRLYVQQVRNSHATPLVSVLVHGPPSSGKTALAARVALDSGFPFIKMISAENMVGFNEMAKVSYLDKVFRDAYKSPLNVIVIDSIERIIDWVPINARFSNAPLQTLMVLLRKQPPKQRRLLIIATTSERSVMSQLGMTDCYDAEVAVPNVATSQELLHILRELNAFDENGCKRFMHELHSMTNSDELGVGVKRILSSLENAQQDVDPPARFASTLARAVREHNGQSGRGES